MLVSGVSPSSTGSSTQQAGGRRTAATQLSRVRGVPPSSAQSRQERQPQLAGSPTCSRLSSPQNEALEAEKRALRRDGELEACHHKEPTVQHNVPDLPAGQPSWHFFEQIAAGNHEQCTVETHCGHPRQLRFQCINSTLPGHERWNAMSGHTRCGGACTQQEARRRGCCGAHEEGCHSRHGWEAVLVSRTLRRCPRPENRGQSCPVRGSVSSAGCHAYAARPHTIVPSFVLTLGARFGGNRVRVVAPRHARL